MPDDTPVRYLNPERRYADAAIHGQVVWLAGQVPTDPQADMATQTLQVLQQIDALLQEAGSHRGRILMAQVIVRDIADVPAMNAVWEAFFDGVTAPPRATFQAPLVNPDWRIEVIVTAALA
jgi:enamine deaminase RidA (YjgF/YER057c/UK114 family)